MHEFVNPLREIQLRLCALLQKRRLDRDMDEEMGLHLELKTQANIASGMSPEEARLAALRQFGWAESVKETCREQRGVTWLDNLFQDSRYAIRILIKNPGFTFVVVVTLALGIGANSAIFSVVNGVVLRPLPYNNPQQLVSVFDSNPRTGFPQFSVAAPNFLDWQTQSKAFQALAAYTWSDFNLSGRDRPERVLGARVSASIFGVYGVQPILGRVFNAEEDQFGRSHVVLLSKRLWQRILGADSAVIGKTLTLNSESYTVIGIMPPNWFTNPEVDLWTPIAFKPGELSNRGGHTLEVVGRLTTGVSLEQAKTEMRTIAQRLEQQYPETNTGWTVALVPLHEQVLEGASRPLLVLLGAVGLVLFIACANVANLLLARATTRQREFAIRAALGAGRGRVIRQLLTESLLLALCSGLLGLLLALCGVKILIALKPANLPRAEGITLDVWVLGFTLLISVLTGIAFGLVPAARASKTDVNEPLREGGKGSTESFRHNRLRGMLVVSEVALSLVLLISAGLMIRSVWFLRRVDPGFKADHVLTLDTDLPEAKYPDAERRARFIQQLLQRVEALPGVQSAAAVFGLPVSGLDATIGVRVEGRPAPTQGEPSGAGYRQISPNYFRTMRTPILKGRDFTDRDRAGAPAVVIVSQTFSRKFFPNEDPIGKRITVGDDGPNPCEIVGVVGDVKRAGLDADIGAEMYLPDSQRCWTYQTVVVRTAHEPLSVANAVGSQVRELDKDQPVHNIRTLEMLVDASISQRRFFMLLLGVFAGIALILAVVGIYGVVSYATASRTHEIGIRMALGAQRQHVLQLIVVQGMVPALVGIAFGLILAFGLTRLMSSLLFSVRPTDAITFATITALLGAVVLLGCYVPARRATNVDPMAALRYE